MEEVLFHPPWLSLDQGRAPPPTVVSALKYLNCALLLNLSCSLLGLNVAVVAIERAESCAI